MNGIVNFGASRLAVGMDGGLYHARRAHQERRMAENAATSDARRSHTEMAVYHEAMAERDGSAGRTSCSPPARGSIGTIGPN